jgi:hypothetical protein
MRISKVTKVVAIVCGVVVASCPAIASPSHTGWANIATLSGGWHESHLRVIVNGAVQNPDQCTHPDGYIVEAGLPGAQLLQSMLITAYATGADVLFTIDGCVLGRPKVIGVDIRKPTGLS